MLIQYLEPSHQMLVDLVELETPMLLQDMLADLEVAEAVVTLVGRKGALDLEQEIQEELVILIHLQMVGEIMVEQDLIRTTAPAAVVAVEQLLTAVTLDTAQVVLAALD